MISNLINTTLSKALTLQLRNNIVIGYQRQRSPFDKTSYNENWVPRQRLYHKSRKPKLAEWSDPNVLFPMIIPPLHTKITTKEGYRGYVRSVIEK